MRALPRIGGWGISPLWSSDGKSIVFMGRDDVATNRGYSFLNVYSPATGERSGLTPKQTWFSPLHRLADGTPVVATNLGALRVGPVSFFKLNLATGDASPLAEVRQTPERFLFGFTVSPDAKRLYYWAGDPKGDTDTLVAREISTGAESALYSAPGYHRAANLGYSYWSNNLIRISPDGNRIATSRDWRTILVVPAAGGSAREIFRLREDEQIQELGGLTWSSDGKWVYFCRGKYRRYGDNIELWRVSAAGGEPQFMGLKMDGLRDLAVSPDGSQLAFTAGQPMYEAWVLENFVPPPLR